jgi:predicted dehydrogenase
MGRVHAAAYRRLEHVQVVAVVDPGEVGRGLASELHVHDVDVLVSLFGRVREA